MLDIEIIIIIFIVHGNYNSESHNCDIPAWKLVFVIENFFWSSAIEHTFCQDAHLIGSRLHGNRRWIKMNKRTIRRKVWRKKSKPLMNNISPPPLPPTIWHLAGSLSSAVIHIQNGFVCGSWHTECGCNFSTTMSVRKCNGYFIQ